MKTNSLSLIAVAGLAIACAIPSVAVAGNPNSRIAKVAPTRDAAGSAVSNLGWLATNIDEDTRPPKYRSGDVRGGAKIGQSYHLLRLPRTKPIGGWIWEKD